MYPCVYIHTRTYPPVDGVDNTQVWKGQGGTSENKVQRAGRQECLCCFKHNLNNKTHNNCWCYNNRMSVFKSSNKRHPQLLGFFLLKKCSPNCAWSYQALYPVCTSDKSGGNVPDEYFIFWTPSLWMLKHSNIGVTWLSRVRKKIRCSQVMTRRFVLHEIWTYIFI